MADMMRFTKTGCNVYIEQRNEWAHGDAFEANGVLILRLVSASRERKFNHLHYTVHNYGPWWDQSERVSTMIAHSYTNHGYDGIPLALEMETTT